MEDTVGWRWRDCRFRTALGMYYCWMGLATGSSLLADFISRLDGLRDRWDCGETATRRVFWVYLSSVLTVESMMGLAPRRVLMLGWEL